MDIWEKHRSGKGKLQNTRRRKSSNTIRTEESDTGNKQPNWKVRSPQQKGRSEEKIILKKLGARVHPNSGAGSIKHDGSTEESLIEIKDANKSFTMNANYLNAFYKTAIKQGKDAVFIVQFPDLIIECQIQRRA